MKYKHLFIIFLVIILFLGIINTSVSANSTQNNKIQKIENFYNSFTTIKSKFTQTDAEGKISSGWFIFEKKLGKARIEYDNSLIRIIINNNSIMLQQLDLDEKSFAPLSSSPFKFLIKNNLSFSDPDLQILNINEDEKYFKIQITSKKQPELGSIILVFNKKNNYLVEWNMIDGNNNIINIKLNNPEFSNHNFPNNIFNTHKIKNIKFNEIK